MIKYKGSKITNKGSDTNTYSSATYNNTYSYVEGAYNAMTYKDGNGNIQYIKYPTYYYDNPYTTISNILNKFTPAKEGWVYTSNGWQQFFGRPYGIKNLTNVIFRKTSPFTMVAAVRTTDSSKAINLNTITPTGLSNLSTILNYRMIAAIAGSAYSVIIIAGVNTSGKFAIWECHDTNYNFNTIWEDNTTYTYSGADIAKGSNLSSGKLCTNRYMMLDVLFHITNNSSIKSKCVNLIYNSDEDTYYRNVTTSNVDMKLINAPAPYACRTLCANNSSSTQYGHVRNTSISTSSTTSYGTITNLNYGNYILPATTCNSFLYVSSSHMICSATVSNTGYIYQSLDGGSTWNQKFYGDNCYRVMMNNPDNIASAGVYFWSVGTTSTNYYRACGMNTEGSWWSSKVTFPSSTLYTNRISIPGYAWVLANSSTVYLYDANKIINSEDQTVSTSSITDENNNAFTVKSAWWNKYDSSATSGILDHTFYVSTNETNGTVLSELSYISGSSYQFVKKTINVGGPVILPTL